MSTQIVCARYNEDINWMASLIPENIIVYNKGNDDLHIFPKEKQISLPNLGREGGTYIHHIINNYDNLADHTIFIQGNPVDHIMHDNAYGSHRTIIDAYYEPKNYNFKYISTHFIHVSKGEIKLYTSGIPFLGVDFVPEIDTNLVIEKALNIQNLPPSSGNDIPNLVSELRNFKNKISIYELTQIIKKYISFTQNEGHHYRVEELYSLFDSSHFENMLGDNYTFGYGALFVASKEAIRKHPKSFYEKIYSTFQEVTPGAGWGLEKMWRFILS
jgi:hypothetical protein